MITTPQDFYPIWFTNEEPLVKQPCDLYVSIAYLNAVIDMSTRYIETYLVEISLNTFKWYGFCQIQYHDKECPLSNYWLIWVYHGDFCSVHDDYLYNIWAA